MDVGIWSPITLIWHLPLSVCEVAVKCNYLNTEVFLYVQTEETDIHLFSLSKRIKKIEKWTSSPTGDMISII